VDGPPDATARLFGAAEALRAATGRSRAASDAPHHERTLTTLRDRLGTSATAAAWEDGRRWTLEQTLAEAQALLSEPAGPERPSAAPAPFGLTPREQEVLHLLARRFTDREIAEALFISPHTVARHVSGILAKLGVHSRREAAAVAAERGLN
ncbi:MAG: response regulator transcription factor, partial [Thermomicrobiales bacterium]